MVLLIDTREKPRAIEKIVDYLQQHEIEYRRQKLNVGDYMIEGRPEIVIDRKQYIAELAKNVTSDRRRFEAELQRAKDHGQTLIILVEQKRYKARGLTIECREIKDLMLWTDPYTWTVGEQVYRILNGLCRRYPVRVEFCDKRSTGKRIMEILNNG